MTGAGSVCRDLYVLTADADMKATMEALLPRHQSLGIRPITFTVDRHLQRDPGCRVRASSWLRPFADSYRYALVMFDREGCGNPASRQAIEAQVQSDLGQMGWLGRSRAVVIDPELEAWVWNRSPLTPRVLRWNGSPSAMKAWLRARNMWPAGQAKPPEPKRAMKAVLRQTGVRHSPTVFEDLARQVGTHGCGDPAFGEMVGTLRQWFPP